MDEKKNFKNNPKNELTPKEEKFFYLEFEKAWDMVFLLDERRIKIIQFYSVVFAVIIGFVANLMANHSKNGDDFSIIAGITILFAGLLIGFSSILFLNSERKANLRYRNKINLIRGIFLKNSNSNLVHDYLSHKKLGIIIMGDTSQPKGWGRTLSKVVWIVCAEIFVQFVIMVYFLTVLL